MLIIRYISFQMFFDVLTNILSVRFNTMKKRLISSYDEINDIFVGKVDGKNGFYADFDILDGIFLGINKDNCPNSIYVSDASRVLNVSKQTLENSNVKITVSCDSICLYFSMFIGNLYICSYRLKTYLKFNSLTLKWIVTINVRLF